MPASSTDGRGKWKRRKRDATIPRKAPKREDPVEDDEEDDPVEEETNINNTNNNSNKNNNRNHTDNDNNNNYNNNNNSNQNEGLDSEDPKNPQPEEAEVVVDFGVRVCEFPRVTRMGVNGPHASILAVVALERANLVGKSGGKAGLSLENVSYGQLQAVSAVPAESVGTDLERSEGGGSGFVITPPWVMEGRGVVKRFGCRVYVVPMHSDWFSPATVHQLERQVVPHFFSGKSPDNTPEKYMECRNYIVAKYMENPEKRLAVSDCQGLVAGIENEDLSRIMRFLDHWGIINYCATAPSRESWNCGSYLREDLNGEVHVPSAALKSIDSLIKFDKPKSRLKVADVYKSVSCHDNITDLGTRLREYLSENRCHYCSQPLPNLHYQSQKEVDVQLCSSCFHDGRFVIGHSSLDFVKVDSRKDYGDLDGETWSDQETLLLLEALEIYNENWNDIADYVGTKSKAQCILHFLRLPMQDGLLDNIEIPTISKSTNQSNGDDHKRLVPSSNGSCVQDLESNSKLPFANSGNPVVALVAFLASAVGPRVAAACAHASLAALSGDKRTDSDRPNGREGNSHEASNTLMQKGDLQHGLPGDQESEATLSADKVKEAAKSGLAAAAMKAKLFADHEEREIQRFSANIINHQLKRLELKLKQFAEVETFLMRECEQVEKTRQRFATERARLLSTRVSPAGVTAQMNLAGASSSLVNTEAAMSRQQMMATSSQPSVSGYGTTNLQGHPNIPFIQRGQQQPMSPLGPRLPLSAIQLSSSGSSNPMFSAPGNSQPNLRC